MTMPPAGGDDRTQAATSAAQRGAGEPTVAATSAGAGPGGPSGPPSTDDGGGFERRPGPLLAGATAAGLLVGAFFGLVLPGSGGGSNATASTSTSSSSTTSSSTTSTSTTSTTLPAAPQILAFTGSPTNPVCSEASRVQLTWSSQNAQSVQITVDGSLLGTFQPTGSASAPFRCPPTSHVYGLTAVGSSGQQTSHSITVTGQSPPTTTTSSTTTTSTTAP